MEHELYSLATKVGNLLEAKKLSVVTAESCTGGLLAAALTEISGSSRYFECGFITYSNRAKEELLGVEKQLLLTHGAVSAQVAQAMALGALHHSAAQVSVAITGIAGPTGATRSKPLGTIYISWGILPTTYKTVKFALSGERATIRRQAVILGLQGLLTCLV